MKFVFASDSFKGTLTSERISGLLTEAAKAVFQDAETVSVIMADGGEGTAAALASACGGRLVPVRVHDALMRPVESFYGLLPCEEGDRAVIEMAAASGIVLLSDDELDPLRTSSFGTGELITAALDEGVRDITVAIGGSATNDGGMGCMRALGARFTDKNVHELEGRGEDLAEVCGVDLSGLDPRLADAHISIMCDVTNPLTGPNGATAVYGPQKGADDEALNALESGMCSYKRFLNEYLNRGAFEGEDHKDIDDIPGTGAAGGLGAALHAFLGAEIKRGTDTVLDITGFDQIIEGADLIVTGEGRADGQSVSGKAVSGVGRRSGDIMTAAIVGCLSDGWEGLYDCGIDIVIALADEKKGISRECAMAHAEELYYDAALNLFRSLRH